VPDEIQRGEPRRPPRLLFALTVAVDRLRSPNTSVLVTNHLLAMSILIVPADRSINGH
jgi:hypothetical protein